MRYPIGVQDFPTIRKEGCVYVDKTDLVYQLAQKFEVFLSRPRRFGKSLLLSTLKEYFSGRKELFEGLKINTYEHEWKKYPVIHISFNAVDFTKSDGLQNALDNFFFLTTKKYGIDLSAIKDVGAKMLNLVHQLHEQYNVGVVVLIDEYDKPLMDALQVPQQYVANHSLLRNFYSSFKDAGEDLKFLMLTGVTKIAKLNVFSGLNQLQDISFHPQFEGLCGITEEELHSVFAESITQLSMKRKCSVDKMKSILKRMYDGYHFSENFTSIYNPFSIINAFENLQTGNYWISSGSSQWLVDMMSGSHFDIEVATRKRYTANELQSYNGSPDEVIALVYQSGYLTISEVKLRDDDTLYRLTIPNGEVRKSFYPLLADRYLKKPMYSTRSLINDINDCLDEDDIDGLLGEIKSFFATIPYDTDNQSTDFEAHYQYTMWLLIWLTTGVDCRLEEKTNKGRIDMVLQNDTHIYLFEFKLDQSAEVARAQIDEKRYADKYDFSGKEVVKVGVNFSSQTRTIDSWI